MVVMFH